MKKKFFSLSNLILGSLIMLLGFGSCRTHKDIKEVYGPPPGYEEELRQQELQRQEMERQEQERIRQEMEKRKREEPKTVYGGPPVRYRE